MSLSQMESQVACLISDNRVNQLAVRMIILFRRKVCRPQLPRSPNVQFRYSFLHTPRTCSPETFRIEAPFKCFQFIIKVRRLQVNVARLPQLWKRQSAFLAMFRFHNRQVSGRKLDVFRRLFRCRALGEVDGVYDRLLPKLLGWAEVFHELESQSADANSRTSEMNLPPVLPSRTM